jgi:hypothetical protein
LRRDNNIYLYTNEHAILVRPMKGEELKERRK